ncbi:MAG: hypothetical protein Q8P18_09425 [Pseudomonadota bacterium]|nr:hypothetical protein [Pseudomonadota bacterium]
MSPPPPDVRPAALRPKAALALIAAAIAVAGGLVLATVGWYATVRGTSGEARGVRARVSFTSTCDAEARPVILARLAEYGLPAQPAPDTGGLAFDVTMPGLPDDLAHVPAALAAPGTLEVRVDGAIRPVVIQDLGVQLAFSGTPVTLLLLEEALPERGVEVWIDGKPADVEEVTGVELQIAARAAQSTDALRLATDRAVALRHPLPCVVTAIGAEALP